MARLATSLLTLRNQLNADHPNRSKLSDGWIGDAAHQAVKSEHNPNKDGVVTALDITHDPKNGVDGSQLAEWLIKDPRVWYVIFNGWIWENGKWKIYSGDNPHDKHLHVSTSQVPVIYDNGGPWNLSKGEDMEQIKGLEKERDETLYPFVTAVMGALGLPIDAKQRGEAVKAIEGLKGLRKERDEILYPYINAVSEAAGLPPDALKRQEVVDVIKKSGGSAQEKIDKIKEIVG